MIRSPLSWLGPVPGMQLHPTRWPATELGAMGLLDCRKKRKAQGV